MQVKDRTQAPQMQGALARWYTKVRGTRHQLEEYRRQAAELTDGLRVGADVLEVAPGPGFMAIELARRGCRVTGLDISPTFVEIAGRHAREAGERIDFRLGDAASLPFEASSFDLVLCQAAFKNFGRPVAALDEMHRVLRPGGMAVIQDMRHEATPADIDREVRRTGLGRLNAFMTGRILRWLRRRAYAQAEFERLAAESAFGACEIRADGIGMEVRLTRRA